MKPLALALLAALAAYTALLYALDALHFGATLLSAGAHTPAWAITGGIALLALRVGLVVLGPGLACALVATALFRAITRRRARS